MAGIIDEDSWEVKLTDLKGRVISTITPPVGLTAAVQVVDAIYRSEAVAINRVLAIVPVVNNG